MKPAQTQIAISPRELSRRISAGPPAELLDVRTPAEFANAHVPGAKLVPLDELDAPGFLRQRGLVDQPLYVLCQSGGRARRAMEQFQRAGFDGCVLVEGGTQAWIDAGLPVNRGESKILPLMRQVQIVVGFVSAGGAALALLVNPKFALIPLVIGCGLLFAGITGFCGLALVLAKMPWNKSAGCKSDSCCTN
ncbi:MAG: rhodanese-like domain-containing protein [Verrucomicrobiota bacterium]